MDENLSNRYIQKAFNQSLYAVGNADPNPPVGAVLVSRQGKLLGMGYTQKYGSDHAEVMALKSADENGFGKMVEGSTLYVTLEPCSHYGKTPPCTLSIIERKIAKVVIAVEDPSKKVQGYEELIRAGLGVEILSEKERGLYREELLWTLDSFLHAEQKKKPRVFLKWAQTKNGFLAPVNGPSGKISGPTALEITHRFRKLLNSVLVTPGTVLTDKPMLTARYGNQDLSEVLNAMPADFLTQMLLTFEKNYPEPFKSLNKRFIMLPRFCELWQKDHLKNYIIEQSRLEGKFYPITDDPAVKTCLHNEFGSDLPVLLVPNFMEMDTIFNYTMEKGAVNLMIEAGPAFCEQIWNQNLADFLMAVVSKEKEWEAGRNFLFARKLRENKPIQNKEKKEDLEIENFRLLYDMDFPSDRYLIFQK